MQTISYRRAGFYHLQAAACLAEFVSETGKRMRTLQIDVRCGRQVKNHEARRNRFLPHSVEDRHACVIGVEVDKAALWTKDERTGRCLIVRMPLHVGETVGARNTAEHGDVGA